MDAIIVALLSPLTSPACPRPHYHHPRHHVIHPYTACPTIICHRPHSHQHRQVHVMSWSPSPSHPRHPRLMVRPLATLASPSHILASPLPSPHLCVQNLSGNGACSRSCHVMSPSPRLTTVAPPLCEREHTLAIALTCLLSLITSKTQKLFRFLNKGTK